MIRTRVQCTTTKTYTPQQMGDEGSTREGTRAPSIMQTLTDIAMNPDAATTEWRAGHRAGIKVCFLKTPLIFNLDHAGALTQCIKFTPSDFGVEGGPRKVTIGLTSQQAGAFTTLEEAVKKQVGDAVLWSSPLKNTPYGDQISCKLANEIQYFDAQARPCTCPAEWRGIDCNACLRISTLWSQRASQGLSVELVALQYTQSTTPALVNPFAG
jgi:hypothetical protein